MNTYAVNQEFKDPLWGAFTYVQLGSQLISINIRWSCLLVVRDADLLQEKVSDSDRLLPYVRTVLTDVANNTATEMGGKFSSVEQLAKFVPELSHSMKTKAGEMLDGFGLTIRELEILAIKEDKSKPPIDL